jgi:hypothetical protein
MRRAGLSAYGPSKAALESETNVWLASTPSDGVTGKRVIADRWRDETPDDAIEGAG